MWKDKKKKPHPAGLHLRQSCGDRGLLCPEPDLYQKNLVYKERLNQMEEITHQMFHNLEDVIGKRWADVNVQCNYLIGTDLQTDTDLYRICSGYPPFPIWKKKTDHPTGR